MRINDLYESEESPLLEAKRIFARKGNKIVMKYRCTSGPKTGRIVSNPATCSKGFDLKKRMTLRKTKSRIGAKMRRKAAKTKRINPASKRLRLLNR